jgi:orotate phosphoribosyltransferase
MPLDIAALLEQTGALLQGHFRLSSGLHSPTYVQCALLLQHPREAKAIGREVAAAIGSHPSRIVSPALGGVIIGYTVADIFHVPFAFTERKEGQMMFRRGFQIERDEPVIIVEDVVTTGRSTRETAAVVEQHGGKVIGFASILNRSGQANPFDAPYASLLSLALETYDPAHCPLCARGVPVDAPGSRYSAAKT